MTDAARLAGDMRPASRAFSAAQSELPMLYVFLAIAAVELVAVHFLVALWSGTAAWILSAATLLLVIQFVRIVHRIRHRPTLITDKALLIRSGDFADIIVPWARIAAVDATGFGPKPSGPGVLNTAILAHPNVKIRLAEPIVRRKLGREHCVHIIALRVDEPDRLIAWVEQRMSADRSETAPRYIPMLDKDVDRTGFVAAIKL